MKCLLVLLAPLVLSLAFAVGEAKAQATPPSARPASESTDTGERVVSPLAWAVAVLCTLVILTIVCVPTRKM